MKKKVLVLSLVMLLLVAVTGTLAYFTADEQVHNIITTSGVDIALEEWQDKDMTIPYPTEPVPVMPGSVVDKVVTVKSLEEDSYIRASYDVIVYDKDLNEMDITAEQLGKMITIQTGEDWTEKEDGVFYYKEAVGGGGVTTPLFCEVVFDGPGVTNEYQNCRFEIKVYAEAVQAANNGENAFEAAGWKAIGE